MNDCEYAIGVDIGGTKIAVAAVDSSGYILRQVTFPTEAAQGFDRAVARLGDMIANLQQSLAPGTHSCRGIGIGCAGPVDPARGLINNPYTLTGWNRCDIVSPLRQRFGLPVALENDADAAAAGECFAGAGQGFDPIVMLTFGTGVGGGVLLGGRIYRGAAGEHPELGHLVVDATGPECYCGTRGCLESLASGEAIGTAGHAAGFADARAVFAAADQEHLAAREIVQRAVQAVSTAAWTLCHTFLPQRLILGGGIMDDQFERFVIPARQRLAKATQFTPAHVEVVRATLGNQAGIVGAAALVSPER